MKKTLRHRDLEELLAAGETPQPPAGLAERIKAEIPEPLRLVEAAQPGTIVRPPAWRRRPLLAAASVAVAVLGGYLALALLDQAPGLGVRAARPAEPARDAQAGVPADERDAAARPEAVLALPGRTQPPAAPPSAYQVEDRPGLLDLHRQAARQAPAEPPAGRTRRDAATFRGGSPRVGQAPAFVPEAGSRTAKEEGDRAAGAPGGAGPWSSGRVEPEPSQAEADRLAEEITVTAEVPAVEAKKLQAATAVGGSEQARRSPVDPERARTARDLAAALRRDPAAARPKPAPGVAPGAAGEGGAEAESDAAEQYLLLAPGYVVEKAPAEPAVEPPARFGSKLDQQTRPAPSTGGTAEPNDQPYGDVFFREAGVNPAIDTEEDPFSTFGLDVDTGSYTVVRRYLADGNLPPREAVRVEELVNFFRYGDRPPRRGEGDFALYAEGALTPFGQGERYRVLRFAVKGREVTAADRKPAVLTFVVDVSGSMERGDRLGLVKEALGLLLGELSRDDRVGLVVYGSRGQVLLEPTSNLGAIRSALERLTAEGSTNAEEGLALGYEVASRHLRPGAVNRLILCSDGVANVGATGPESILARIEREARRGIELTTVGFGMGNYNDALMEQLADRGDGRYAYVDDLGEARRIFVEELTGTLETIASDAKVQVEFNPEAVARWRLLGYENRDVADERFRDDTVDAGEIGAGHTVTAVYEVKLAEEPRRGAVAATLRLRYRSKASGEVVEQERELLAGDLAASWEEASPALRLASLVAEYGEILRGSYWAKEGSLDEVFRRAQRVALAFPGDAEVAGFAGLAGRAAELARRAAERPDRPQER